MTSQEVVSHFSLPMRQGQHLLAMCAKTARRRGRVVDSEQSGGTMRGEKAVALHERIY